MPTPTPEPALKTQTPGRASGSDRIVVLEGDGESYQDVQHAKRTVELLKKYRDAGQPFFLYLAFTIPHANNELKNKGMEVPDDAPYTHEEWPQP